MNSLFDPQKSLLSLPVFKALVIIHTTIAISASITIVKNSNLHFELSYSGFNFFIEAFRLPLAILALIIPTVALLASNHRSVQTAAQIKAANSQNTFSNHYKHLEEFEKYCKDVFEEANGISKPRILHKLIYPNSKHGSFLVSEKYIESIEIYIGRIIEIWKELQHLEISEALPLFIEIKDLIKKFDKDNHLKPKLSTTSNRLALGGLELSVPNGDARYFYLTPISQLRKLHLAMQFDSYNIQTKNISIFLNIDTAKIPPAPLQTLANYKPLMTEQFLIE